MKDVIFFEVSVFLPQCRMQNKMYGQLDIAFPVGWQSGVVNTTLQSDIFSQILNF